MRTSPRSPSRRGDGLSGLATGLVIALVESLWLFVTVENRAAVGFYPLLGFLFWAPLGYLGGHLIFRLRSGRRRPRDPARDRAGTGPAISGLIALCSVALLGIAAVCATGGKQISVSLYQPSLITADPSATATPELLVLGIDGASWTILQPMINGGELPTLRGLMERGTWGTLLSDNDSFSPVVWNTIMTGKPAEAHGVTSLASERRVRAVWEIATAAGYTSAVINVPGTYPVRAGAQVMMAGFPVRARQNLSNLGWVISSSPSWREPDGPVFIPLDLDPQSDPAGARRHTKITLRDLPVAPPLDRTVVFRLLRPISDADERYQVQRLLGAVPFLQLEVEVKSSVDGSLRILGRDRGQEDLFNLRRNEWSDWLTVDSGRWSGYLKIQFVDSTDGLTLFSTPIFAAPDDEFLAPAKGLAALAPCPYVAEGVGWALFRDPRLLGTLATHQMDVASCRFDTGLAVLEQYNPDLLIYVFTVTDRLQHAFLKYLYTDEYARLADVMGGEFEKRLALPEQIDRFAHVVPDAFRRIDRWMGELFARVDPSTPVLILSDHGSMPGAHMTRPTAGVHNPEGIYVVSTAGEHTLQPDDELAEPIASVRQRGTPGPELVLEDLTAMILHLMDLPVGEDMTGRVPPFLVAPGNSVSMVLSHDSGALETGGDEINDPAILEQMRSLGYIE